MIGLASLAASALFVVAASTPSVALADAAPEATADIATLTVEVEGIDRAALISALNLRLSGLRVAGDGDAAMRPGDVHLRLVRAGDGSLAMTASLANGGVLRRELAAGDAASVRTVATSIAHWLAAIATGRVAPQAGPAVAQGAPLVSESATLEPPMARPHECPPASMARPRECPPVQRPFDAPPSPRSDALPPVPRPTLALGPVAGFVPTFGVGRPSALAGSLGVAVAAGLELRLPRGALFGAELRVMDTRAGDHRLTRLRGALLGGHALVRARFTLRTLAAVTVEPWWAGDAGATLFGGALRVTPGLRARVGPRLHMHAGLRLELAVSGTAGAAAVRLVDGTRPVFRVGGVELGTGVELGLAWDVRRRRAGSRLTGPSASAGPGSPRERASAGQPET